VVNARDIESWHDVNLIHFTTMAPPPFMDNRSAPFHPCSVETIPDPVKLTDGRLVWPLMLSCYQLENGTTDRVGYMDLSLISVPDIANHASAMPLQFDKSPYRILDPKTSTGILDGKWSTMPSKPPSDHGKSWCFASAHSSGEIRIHSVNFEAAYGDKVSTGRVADNVRANNYVDVEYLGQSCTHHTNPDKHSHTLGLNESVVPTPAPLCLSLCWDDHAAVYRSGHSESGNSNVLSRIVATYSNGTVSIFDVAFASDGRRVQLIERDSWEAHCMFTSPSEVWSACWVGQDCLASGGDEGKLKIWDIRATTRPMQVLDEPFAAGVTCVSPHPFQQHILAVGSCTYVGSMYCL
jgi:WD40 repeat protein